MLPKNLLTIAELTGIKHIEQAKLLAVEAINEINARTGSNTKKKVLDVKMGVTSYPIENNILKFVSVKEKTTQTVAVNKQIVTENLVISPAASWLATTNVNYFIVKKNGSVISRTDLGTTTVAAFKTAVDLALAEITEFTPTTVVASTDLELTILYEEDGVLYEFEIHTVYGSAGYTMTDAPTTAVSSVTKYMYANSARWTQQDANIDVLEQ